MEHQEAIEIYAAEGYLLDELTDAEREGFEQHYADCESCFADVRDGVRFIHALPAAAKEEKGTHQKRWPSIAAAAAIACAVTAGIGQVALVGPMRAQMAKLQQPHPAKFYRVAVNRNEAPTLAGNSDSILEFDIVTDQAPPYTCTIVNSRGEKELSVAVSAVEAKDPVRITIPAGSLRPASYSVIVTGHGGKPDTISFTVQ